MGLMVKPAEAGRLEPPNALQTGGHDSSTGGARTFDFCKVLRVASAKICAFSSTELETQQFCSVLKAWLVVLQVYDDALLPEAFHVCLHRRV